MSPLKQIRQKYLIILPIIFLILNAFYFKYATQEIQNALLKEKYDEVVNAVDMLSAAVEANSERAWQDHEDNIVNSIEFFDNLHQIYAGAYKRVDDDITLLTESFYEYTCFDPFNYDEFSKAIESQENGHILINYISEKQSPIELLLYFRWTPIYSSSDERYLIVTGVSEYSITASVSLWVSIGQWASALITFVLNAWMIILYIRLGNICARKDCEKWRNGWKWRRG